MQLWVLEAYISETFTRILRGESKEEIYQAMREALSRANMTEEDKQRFMDIVYAKAYIRALVKLGKLADEANQGASNNTQGIRGSIPMERGKHE